MGDVDPVGFWADALGEWAIPEEILRQAPESPWFHDPATFAADEEMDTRTVSYQKAREALASAPLGHGSVLDVGCGGGRSSLGLTPEATHITGVDGNERMLAGFAAAAAARGLSHAEVQGQWPGSASQVDTHDVVVCHHVLYNVAGIEPFVRALHAKARRRVLVELTTDHPSSMMNAAWQHFWNLDRPTRPTSADARAAIAAIVDKAVGYHVSPRAPLAAAVIDPVLRAAFLRRRLCLAATRDSEILQWLGSHPLDRARDAATIWWDTEDGEK